MSIKSAIIKSRKRKEQPVKEREVRGMKKYTVIERNRYREIKRTEVDTLAQAVRIKAFNNIYTYNHTHIINNETGKEVKVTGLYTGKVEVYETTFVLH